LRLSSFGGYGLTLAALALKVFGATEGPPTAPTSKGNVCVDRGASNFFYRIRELPGFLLGLQVCNFALRLIRGPSKFCD